MPPTGPIDSGKPPQLPQLKNLERGAKRQAPGIARRLNPDKPATSTATATKPTANMLNAKDLTKSIFEGLGMTTPATSNAKPVASTGQPIAAQLTKPIPTIEAKAPPAPLLSTLDAITPPEPVPVKETPEQIAANIARTIDSVQF